MDAPRAFCTIVAQNYLPQAIALYGSVRKAEPSVELTVLVTDGERRDLEHGRPGLRMIGLGELGLSRRELLDLAAIYDVVEFATAIKPLLLLRMLERAHRVVYLDPDMLLETPLVELDAVVDEHGIVLTPHFLRPVPVGTPHISDGHALTVGVHNLGFIAVGPGAVPFLEWWWERLRWDCLIYPLLGLFVDQKWTDAGASLFDAYSLRHAGYNVGPWNLHERTLLTTPTGITAAGEPLRIVHFSGFDPEHPETISERLNASIDAGTSAEALDELGARYARAVLDAGAAIGPLPEYAFARDSGGRKIRKRDRMAYRKDLLSAPAGKRLPSPFVAAESTGWDRWRRRRIGVRAEIMLADAAIAMKYVLPDLYDAVRRAQPQLFRELRAALLGAGRIRR